MALCVLMLPVACAVGKVDVKSLSSSSGSAISSSVSLSSAPSSSSMSSLKPPLIFDGFVQLKDLDPDFVIDLKYATADNFTHQVVYPTDICVLRVATADKLVRANAEFKKHGYRIKVWDAYRPLSVQKIFWSIMPDTRYVADPSSGGSVHNRGCAVDITLVDSSGSELEMPSGFDDFTEKAYRDNPDMTPQAKANLELLTGVMTENGFKTITTEWWHYEDTDAGQYTIADIDLTQFENN